MIIFIFFNISKAQIAFLKKELSEKEMSKIETDILREYATEVQQQLQQQEEKEQQQQRKKQQQLEKKKEPHVEKMEKQPYKEHHQPQIGGEAYFIWDQAKKKIMSFKLLMANSALIEPAIFWA